MLNVGLPQINIGPLVKYGLAAVLLGGMFLFVFMGHMNKPKVLEIPEETPADEYYRQWRRDRLARRVGRGWVFVTFLGIGLLLGGCGAVIIGIVK